jgi:hypothetical protein
MSEPKFTKGPWRVGKPFHNTPSRQDVTPIYWDTPPCGECGRSYGEWLVAWTFPNSLKKPQYKFNAHLIAAAPDMYVALEQLIDDEPCEYDHHGNCQTHNLGNPCGVAMAIKALAKARGEVK